MKTTALVLAVAALAAGCSTPPQNLLGTQGRNPDELAVIVVESDQVKITEVNGTALPGPGTNNFYVPPGAHKFVIDLHWCPGGLCVVTGGYASKPRTACVDAKAGMSYRFTAGSPGPDWTPRVTQQKGTGDATPIDAVCR